MVAQLRDEVLMDPKTALKNGSFCPCPWTGFIMQADGSIKNCVAAQDEIGNVNTDTLDNILASDHNRQIKRDMLAGVKNPSCETCHIKEQNNPMRLNIVSNRIYYLKELARVPYSLYDSEDNFELHTVDLRWRNTCNFACVYCDPVSSSRWAQELKQRINIENQSKQDMLKYIVDHAEQLKNIYFAGGEPFMIKENRTVLQTLKERNPSIQIRVNTNLSQTDTGIFEQLCEFENVHWIISVDSMGTDFEYIRHGGVWQDFVRNLQTVRKLGHQTSFNMLWLILNARSLFHTIDWLSSEGFHNNSMILGPITGPRYLDVRNLSESTRNELEQTVVDRQNPESSWLLEHGYQILLDHLRKPFESNLANSIEQLRVLDKRRNINSELTFPWLYKEAGL